MSLYARISIIEQQIGSLLLSYQRLQKLAGLPGYDPALVGILKKDMDFLEQEKKRLLLQDDLANNMFPD